MLQGSGRRGVSRTNGVVAGSVWESRMRMDRVKGGIKVFNGEDRSKEGEGTGGAVAEDADLPRVVGGEPGSNQGEPPVTERRKRRSWGVPEPDKTPIQLRKALLELSEDPPEEEDEDCRELGVETTFVLRSSGDVGGIWDRTAVTEGGGGGGGSGEKDRGQGIAVDVVEAKRFDDKEVDLPKVNKGFDFVQEKKIDQIRQVPVLLKVEKKQRNAAQRPDAVDHGIVKPPPIEVKDDFYESITEPLNRMQSIVDLVMWRDISRSALAFGSGAFLLLASSYAEDLNFSLISSISFMGLLCLAAIFLYKSMLCSEGADIDESDKKWSVGEEEAIWLIKKALPYTNEILTKLRSLFSGDPVTTMKMSVVLFVLTMYGGEITLWTMAKLAFFGVFTIPRLCASYSTHQYGTIFLERFTVAWDSCSHKKAISAALFTLLWNVSSIPARIWAVFMLVVALRYYQQHCLGASDWDGADIHEDREDEVVVAEKQRQGGGRGGLKLEDDANKVGQSVAKHAVGLGLGRHRQRWGPSGFEVVGVGVVKQKEKKRS